MHLEQIIQVIKQRRAELDVTQDVLSELSGVGLRTLKGLEAGKGNPTLDNLLKIADVLGLELRLEVKQLK